MRNVSRRVGAMLSYAVLSNLTWITPGDHVLMSPCGGGNTAQCSDRDDCMDLIITRGTERQPGDEKSGKVSTTHNTTSTTMNVHYIYVVLR